MVIAQPSMLLGDRAALGQPPRSGEIWAARLLAPLGWMIAQERAADPGSRRGVRALAAILDAKPGVRVLKSGAMQEMAEVAVPYTRKP